MVLDEDALEAMLQRGRREGADEGSQQAELTDQTEEFEVYERPQPRDEPPEPDASQGRGDGSQHTVQETTQAPAPEPMRPDPQPAQPEPQAPVQDAQEPQQEQAQQEQSAIFQPLTPRPQEPPQAQPEPAREPEAAPEHATEPAQEEVPAAPAQQTRSHAPEPMAQPTQMASGDGSGQRIALVWARFNEEITEMMADLARKRIDKLGAELTAEAQVPGVYDLPLTTKRLLARDDVDGVVVLGVVVKGETEHDRVITQAAANQLTAIACQLEKPIGFGVTGPGMTWKQAEARMVNAKHAVDAVVQQLAVLRQA